MEELRYRFGFDTLGPVFGAFARLLLAAAKRDGVTRLAFVSRDGHFLREVVRHTIQRLEIQAPPELDYIHLSRASTISSRYRSLRDALHAEQGEIFGARPTSLGAILRYFGIDPGILERAPGPPELRLDAPLRSPDDVIPLIENREAGALIEAFREQQRELVHRYLLAQNVEKDSGTALVDIGWRGTTAAAAAAAFGLALRTYYLGYWDEEAREPRPECPVTGLLSDIRRRRTLLEGAAYHVAYLLEALCRAPHGTVLRFAPGPDGSAVPVLADDPGQRTTEARGEHWREPIRRGILDYIDATAERAGEDQARTRRAAQRRLFRLAFFPTPSEIEAIAGLAHTEGHEPDWSVPLIVNERHTPLGSPRRWVAGLVSPWRGAYIMATGGYPLAITFIVLESLLLAVPASRRVLRRAALSVAAR